MNLSYLDQLKPSPLALFRHIKIPGRKTLNFLSGDVGFKPDPLVVERYKQALDEPDSNLYPPLYGVPALREAAADYLSRNLGTEFTPDEVGITAGGVAAISISHFALLFNRKGKALSFSPYWTPMKNQPQLFGGKFVTVPLDSRFQFDPERIKYTIEQEGKIDLFEMNTPHNPTGKVFTLSEFEALAEILKKNGIYLVLDIPYWNIVYDGKQPSIYSVPGMEELTIINYSFSKEHNVTGYRIGLIASKNKEFMNKIASPFIQFFNTVNHPGQKAMAKALELGLNRKNLQALKQKRDLLISRLNRIAGVNCITPQGAYYAFPDFSGVKNRIPPRQMTRAEFQLIKEMGIGEEKYDEIKDRYSWQLFRHFLDCDPEYSIVTAPGDQFGEEWDGYLRFSFSKPDENDINNCMDILEQKLGTRVSPHSEPRYSKLINPI